MMPRDFSTLSLLLCAAAEYGIPLPKIKGGSSFPVTPTPCEVPPSTVPTRQQRRAAARAAAKAAARGAC